MSSLNPSDPETWIELNEAIPAPSPITVPASGPTSQSMDPANPATWRDIPTENPRAVVLGALGKNPDRAARDEHLAVRYKAMPELVADAREDFEQRAALDDASERLAAAPRLSAWMAQRPNHAALVLDDLDNASRLEALTTIPLTGKNKTKTADEGVFWDRVLRGGGGIAQGGADVVRWYTRFNEMLYDGLHALTGAELFKGAADYARTSSEDILKMQQRTSPNLEGISKFVHDFERTLPAIGLQTLLAYTTGGIATSVGTMAVGNAADQYGELKAQGVAPGRAMAASFANQAAQTPLYALQFGKFFDLFKVPAGALGRATGESVLANAGGNFAGYFPDAYSRLWAEAEKEGRGSGGATWRYFLSNMDQHLKEAGYSAALGLPLSLAGGGGRLVYEMGRYQALGRDRALFTALDQSAENSKLRTRLPEAYQRLVAHMTEDGPVERLYLAPEALRGAAGDETTLYDLADKMGVTKEAFDRAENLGADLEVPLAKYQAHIAGTETSLKLREHLRSSPDAMTPAEAEVFQNDFQREARRLLDESRNDIAKQSELDKAIAPIAEKLSPAMSAEVVKANMALLRARAEMASAQWGAAGESISPAQWITNKWALRAEVGGGKGTVDAGELAHAMYAARESTLVDFFDRVRSEGEHAKKSFFGWSGHGALEGFEVRVPSDMVFHQTKRHSDMTAADNILLPELLKTIPESQICEAKRNRKQGIFGTAFLGYKELNGVMYGVAFEVNTKNQIHIKTFFKDSPLKVMNWFEQNTEKVAKVPADLRRTQVPNGSVTLGQPLVDKIIQSASDGNPLLRGSITFSEGETLIRIFRDSADVSTLPHELGHLFMRDMEELVKTGRAPKQLVDDMRTLEAFTADATEPQRLQAFYEKEFAPHREAYKERGFDSLSEAERAEVRFVATQEKLANAFVTYLKEGRAPSPELRSAFGRFRDWLVNLYRNLSGQGVEINPELRAVFDRMLASKRDIALAEELHKAHAAETAALDAVAKEMLTEEEQHRLSAARAGAKETSLANRVRKSLDALFRAAAPQKAFMAEARERVDAMPVYAAQDEAIRAGGIDYDGAVDFLGEAAVKSLAKKRPGLLRKNGSVRLEDLALAYDFESAASLADAILRAPGKQADKAAFIAELRQKRENALAEELGLYEDAPGEGDYYNDERLEVLLLESKALRRKFAPQEARKTGTATEARRHARDLLDAMPAREAVNIGRLSAAEARAAAVAVKLLEEGDAQGSANAKRRQAITHAMVLEAMTARREADSFAKALRRYVKSDKMEFAHQEQILALAERYKMGAKGRYAPRKPEKRTSLRDFIKETTEDSIFEAPPFSDFILSEFVPENMTLGQLREVREAVRWLAEEGQPGEARLLTEGMQGTVADAVRTGTHALSLSGNTFTYKSERTAGRAVQDAWQDVFSGLDHVKFMLMAADGYREIGKKKSHLTGLHSRLFQLVMDAQNENSRLFREARPELERLTRTREAFIRRFEKLFGKFATEVNGVPVPDVMAGVGRKHWTAERIWCLARNMGNEGNLKTLHEGFELSDSDLYALTSVLTRDEWLAIQAEGNLIGREYDRTDVVFRKIYGRPMPDKVKHQALTVLTADDGKLDLPGWYYPIAPDTQLSPEIGDRKSVDMVHSSPDFTAYGPSLAKGHTKARTGTGKPVALSFGVFEHALWDQWRFLTHAPIIRDFDRISRNKDWRKAYTAAFGSDYYKHLRGWLKYTARPVSERGDWLDSLVNKQRQLATVYSLGLNTQTFLRQFQGYLQAIPDLGASWILRGIGKMGWNPMAMVRHVNGMSLFMADRDKNFVRELRRDTLTQQSILKMRIKNRTYTGQDVQEAAMSLVALGDRLTTYPIWQGAYMKAVERLNLPQKDAVAYADGIVQKTQASNSVADLNAWQRESGKSMKRLFSMFMSESMRKGSRMRYWWRALQAGKIGTGDYVNHLLMETVAPALFFVGAKALLTSTQPEGEDVAEQIWNEAVGPLPFLSQLSGVFTYGGSMSKSPAFKGVELFESVGRSAWKISNRPNSSDAHAAFFKSLVDVAAYAAGTGNVRRVYETAAEGWDDIMHGETANPFRIFFRKPKERR